MPDLSSEVGPSELGATGAVDSPSGAKPRTAASSHSFSGLFHARVADIAILVLLALLGAAEGWLRRTDLASDAIPYLNLRDAILHGNWTAAFNPFWSAGYPFLLALARPFFPSTPGGDWASVHVTNLVIFLGTWAAFLLLLRSIPLENEANVPARTHQQWAFLKVVALSVFVAIELSMDAVSRVGPDLLVTCFIFLAVAGMLRLVRRPTLNRAAILGCILGLGYWVKAIALPLSLVVLATGAVALLARKRSGLRCIPLAVAIFVLVALPNVMGISHSYGSFTLGESGALNYQFHVNLLPHWTNWQGGPLAIYGSPVHPTHQVMSSPPLFVFAKPFHDTYPPYGDVAYWYKGYRGFFNARLQALGILRDGRDLLKILFGLPFLYAAVAALLALLLGMRDRRAWRRRLLRLWPLYVPALAGIALYLLVHVEARYLASFFAILFIVPFLAAAHGERLPSRKAQALALALVAIGAVVNLAIADRSAIENFAHGSYYTNDPEWMLGNYLRTAGLKSGEGVAAVGGPNAFCEWAYMDGLRLVAELGGDPYDQRNPEKTSPGVNAALIRSFWENPQLRDQVLARFREAGAAAVIAPSKPPGLKAEGWMRPTGAKVWVYRY